MSNQLSAIERGAAAIKDMEKKGIKINLHSVAKHSGFNHTMFNKPLTEWADLKDDLEKAKKRQVKAQLADDIDKLKKEIITLKRQLREEKKKNKENKKEDNVSSLVAALLETYRLNDILIAENNDFKNREVHRNEGKILRIDSDSGEIIKF
jgi:septal ring factor EnvC (AmiA/AmiB activator)